MPVTRVSHNCVHLPFHSIFHSTVPFHIPVQRLEIPVRLLLKITGNALCVPASFLPFSVVQTNPPAPSTVCTEISLVSLYNPAWIAWVVGPYNINIKWYHTLEALCWRKFLSDKMYELYLLGLLTTIFSLSASWLQCILDGFRHCFQGWYLANLRLFWFIWKTGKFWKPDCFRFHSSASMATRFIPKNMGWASWLRR